ncbi:uncharacterized protein [Blastocystis hominis]|uniref:cysteine--tRNA ligase n=1 Tax=Blastocystis hominis TaxID=12968 RepID=D8M9S2_BLAHO|nr:uncharacterized protein [Blastocystis hominis]CBK24811.2 unnamed protein product [Blastocystis hominis]|eukprot:XP_012898859.1 uncharacterized protein [Blastocystis hominis]
MIPRKVLWYSCGPTVYDVAHMGHARTYLSQDIIMRILRDYFNYDVQFVMNITDIDDKIIKRSTEAGIPFTELARKYENEFMEDMKTLGCRTANVITRVSEYVDEIIEMIQGIINNGYAYEANGSVYFDTTSFQKNHVYGKLSTAHAVLSLSLVPEMVGNVNTEEEQDFASEKRHPNDFALWKASKPGEPMWNSPWGAGRPGWHIECSAMSFSIFKTISDGRIDVHSGGVDLRLPHHTNEMAQSEAYMECSQSVNYFLHTGHLNIDGLKMSKSLKNFITIRQTLQQFTPSQIRIYFLLHKWNTTMNYSDGAMEEARAKEKLFAEFFHNVKATLRQLTADQPQRWDDAEVQLNAQLDAARTSVHTCLCDDFDTAGAMEALEGLVRAVYRYLETAKHIVAPLVLSCAGFVSQMFRVFGLIEPEPKIGFAAGEEAADREAVLSPVVEILSKFRTVVKKNRADPAALLKLCDEIRDDILPFVGIRLEDTANGTIWKLEAKETLIAEREKKLQLQKEKELEKKRKEEERMKKEKEKEEKAKIDPKTMFLGMTELYSQFDERGIPTHDAKGEPITKSGLKKIMKLYQAQEKLHNAWLEKNQQ